MPVETESDPRHHTQKMKARVQEIIDHLRGDIDKVDDPKSWGASRVSERPRRTLRAPRYLSDALIASSALEPGQRTSGPSSLSGRGVVPRLSCSSLAFSLR